MNWEGEIQIISEARKEGESEEELGGGGGGGLDGKINKGSLGLAGRISNQIKIRQNKSASNKKHKVIGVQKWLSQLPKTTQILITTQASQVVSQVGSVHTRVSHSLKAKLLFLVSSVPPMDREITERTETTETTETTERIRKIMFPRCPRHSTRRLTHRCKIAKANVSNSKSGEMAGLKSKDEKVFYPRGYANHTGRDNLQGFMVVLN